MPAWGEPDSKAASLCGCSLSAALKKLKFGPSAKGGRVQPHHTPPISSGGMPAAVIARRAANQASVRASSDGPQTAT